jgi:peptidyl-prolyl cis-trans isomerase SurA
MTKKNISYLLWIFFTLQTSTAFSSQLIDEVVAVVNEDIILLSDVNYAIKTILKNSKKETTSTNKKLNEQVLNQLINNKLMIQRAVRLGITNNPQKTDELIEKIAIAQKISTEKLAQKITAAGLNYKRFRAGIAEEDIIKRLTQYIVSKRVSISDIEINQIIKKQINKNAKPVRFKLVHILIAEKEENQALAFEVRKKWQEEKSYASFANNPNLEIKDLGLRDKSSLPQVLYDAIFSLEKGDISQVIKLANGFHILKVVDKINPNKKTQTQVQARHILITANKDSDIEAIKKQMIQLRTQIKNGKKFSQIAIEHSEDPASAKKGGDLGWFARGSMVPEFERMAFKMEIGEISPVFATSYGFHILQVTNKRQIDIDEKNLRKAIKEQLFAKKSQEVINKWQKTLKDGAFIKKIK